MSEGKPVCKMCRRLPASRGAHIYSRGFFKDAADGDALFCIPADPSQPVLPGRMGPKDYEILCEHCETRFQKYDKHAVEVSRLEPSPISQHLAEIATADARTLKLFFMHVLWRAHWSARDEFVNVDLNDLGREKRLRSLLLRDDPGRETEFPCLIVCYDRHPVGHIIQTPSAIKWKANHARSYEFGLGRWRAVITPSAGGLPAPLRDVALAPGRLVRVFRGGSYETSPAFRDAIENERRRMHFEN